MRSAWFRRLGLAAIAGWLSVAGVAAGNAGCAATRGEINRVQADAIRKADLVGDDYRDLRGAPEFYMRNLIAGVQRTNPYFSDGLQDPTRRVRFEIQENYLIVRQAYQYIEGSDGHGGVTANTEQYTVKSGDTYDIIASAFGTKADKIAKLNNDADLSTLVGKTILIPGKANTGIIVAMYPIESHFDIKQDYNPVTGELYNVWVENTTDRRWYEREYMRVDWSKNLVIDSQFFEFWYPKAFGELQMQPVQYYENDPRRAEVSNLAEMNSGYFDITSRWITKPGTANFYGYQVPDCLVANMHMNPDTYTEGSVECEDQEVVIRTSFMKVPDGDADTDYEAFETDGQQLQIVGTLDLERFSYDRQYGVVDQTWHQFVQRYNIWQKSHIAGATCGDNNDKASGDATCAQIDPNSVCDMNKRLCTLPYTQRAIRPIVFYADSEIPTELQPATGKAIGIWNDALMNAVAFARETECRRASGTPADGTVRSTCHTQFFDSDPNSPTQGQFNPAYPDVPKASNGPVAVFCHNPVVDADNHDLCGQTGKTVRKGDIRHHMISWWSNPSFESPLGVVVMGGDPLSGEQVGTSANIFGGSLESAVAWYRDMIQLVNGDVSPSEFVAGVPAQLYGSPNAPYQGDPVVDPALDAWTRQLQTRRNQGMTAQEIQARLKAIDVSKTTQRLGLVKALEGAKSVDEKMQRAVAYMKQQGTLGTPGFGGFTEFAQKLANATQQVQQAGLDKQLLAGNYARGFGFTDQALSQPGVGQAISPLGAMSPSVRALVKQQWDALYEQNHICRMPSALEAVSINHFDGVAAKYKARYPDGGVASGDVAKLAGVEGQTIDRAVRGKLIYWELMTPVYVDVVVHEMGHLMSEDHDFGGSWDSVNYFPEYWQLRAHNKPLTDPTNAACDPANPRKPTDPDTCMGPRYLDPATQDELGTQKGNEHDQIESYGTASIMDYHSDSRYWPAGLGLYDKMAAKFIYGRLVEVFDDDAHSLITGSKRQGNAMAANHTSMLGGDWSYKRDIPALGGTSDWPTHYTEIARQLNLFDPKRCRPATDAEKVNGVGQYGQVCAPVNRDHTFLRDMTSGNLSGGYTGYYKERTDLGFGGRIRWPYKFGPSAFANYPHIATFDQGADFYEVTSDIINWYDFWYLSAFFRRNEREFNPWHIQEWLYDRVFDRVHLLAWDSINSAVLFQGFFPGSTIFNNPIASDPNWALGDMMSMTMLFDMMQRALLRPEPGGYSVQVNNPGQLSPVWQNPTKGNPTATFTLGGFDARYIDDDYDTTQGWDFRAYVKRVGVYNEKVLAGIGLTDSTPPLSTISRDTYLDGRNVLFSFRSALPQGMDRLMAGVLAEDWDTVAPYVAPNAVPDGSGTTPLSHVNLWDTTTSIAAPRPAGAKVVDPMLGYQIQSNLAFLTMLLQPIDTNMELVNRMRVWVEGGPEGVKLPDDQKVTFFDPVEGNTWGAQIFGTEIIAGKTVQVGVGARELDHANDLLAAAYNVKVDPVTNKVVYQDGRPVVDTTGGETTLTVKDTVAAAKLRQYVGNLNFQRQVLWYLGFGPLSSGYQY